MNLKITAKTNFTAENDIPIIEIKRYNTVDINFHAIPNQKLTNPHIFLKIKLGNPNRKPIIFERTYDIKSLTGASNFKINEINFHAIPNQKHVKPHTKPKIFDRIVPMPKP